jgi:ABC-type nitrate/sulfonate/bicarbonate transport system substrate-binding protein
VPARAERSGLGAARGSGGEVFWLATIDKLKLNPADYTVVNVEAPEMVAALERGNIYAYALIAPAFACLL